MNTKEIEKFLLSPTKFKISFWTAIKMRIARLSRHSLDEIMELLSNVFLLNNNLKTKEKFLKLLKKNVKILEKDIRLNKARNIIKPE